MPIEQIDAKKYPIGKFLTSVTYTPQEIQQWIAEIKALPGKIRAAVTPLTDKQLDTPYRDGGWTIRQVVHHLADSHSNSLTRFKLALTEENPIIKPYREDEWARLPDYQSAVEPALMMLEGTHLRWVALLEALTEDQWNRTFVHPAYNHTYSLHQALAMYVWHGNHHLAHITCGVGG